MQRWWEEQEARLNRLDSAHSLALTLVQRFSGIGLASSLALPVAHGLGAVQSLTADLVKLTESLLLTKLDDPALLRAHLTTFDLWAEQLLLVINGLKQPMDQLMTTLAWEPNPHAAFAKAEESRRGGSPQERAKLDGRYGGMHYLYERLDLQLESAGLAAPIRQGLARSTAEVYDALLSLARELHEVSRMSPPRRGAIGELLLEAGAVLQLKLAPRHLSLTGPVVATPVVPGFRLWLRLAAAEGAFS